MDPTQCTRKYRKVLFVAKAVETYQEGLQSLSLTDGPKKKKKSLGSFAMC